VRTFRREVPRHIKRAPMDRRLSGMLRAHGRVDPRPRRSGNVPSAGGVISGRLMVNGRGNAALWQEMLFADPGPSAPPSGRRGLRAFEQQHMQLARCAGILRPAEPGVGAARFGVLNSWPFCPTSAILARAHDLVSGGVSQIKKSFAHGMGWMLIPTPKGSRRGTVIYRAAHAKWMPARAPGKARSSRLRIQDMRLGHGTGHFRLGGVSCWRRTSFIGLLVKINGMRKKLGADPRQAGVRGHCNGAPAKARGQKAALCGSSVGRFQDQRFPTFEEIISPKDNLVGQAGRLCRWAIQDAWSIATSLFARKWLAQIVDPKRTQCGDWCGLLRASGSGCHLISCRGSAFPCGQRVFGRAVAAAPSILMENARGYAAFPGSFRGFLLHHAVSLYHSKRSFLDLLVSLAGRFFGRGHGLGLLDSASISRDEFRLPTFKKRQPYRAQIRGVDCSSTAYRTISVFASEIV